MKLFRKKSLWIPTWQGFILISILIFGILLSGVFSVYAFLAQQDPRHDAEWVVVEGWLPDSVLVEILQRTQTNQMIVTTGGPIQFCGNLFQNKTYAEVTMDRLIFLGVSSERLICASVKEVDCDRTYASALAVRERAEQRGLFGKPCTVYSLGTHSRRSFYLYRKAFGAHYPVGIVAMESSSLDERHWWRSSQAFKQVFGECIAWIYTLFSSCKYA